MSDDDIRDVLAAYAATTPDLDPRAGLAHRLARHGRARRAAVTVTACLAAVALAGGVSLVVGDDRGTSELTVADDPSPTPSETAEPSTEPTPTESAEPSAEPSATEPAMPASTPSPTESGPPQAGPPVSRTVDGKDGFRARAWLSASRVGTAVLVTLRIDATDPDGQPRVSMVDWGDGVTEPIPVVAADCPGRPPLLTPSPRAPRPGDTSETFDHAWRNAGTYRVEVQVTSDYACDDAPGDRVTIPLDLEVVPWQDRSNGPAEPREVHAAVVEAEETEDLYDYRAEISVGDSDGYVRAIRVDWGDGSEPFVARNDESCDDGDGDHFPSTVWAADGEHRYAPGDYVVTVTFVSVGCDGEDRQSARKKIRVEVPEYVD